MNDGLELTLRTLLLVVIILIFCSIAKTNGLL